MTEITEGEADTLLAYLAQYISVRPLDTQTEINVRMVRDAHGLSKQQAYDQIERWVEAGLIVACANKRTCPVTGRQTNAWRETEKGRKVGGK